MNDPIRILIVDDHPLFRRGVRQLLEMEPGFAPIAEASSGQEAIRIATETEPDLILLDLNMDGMNGIDVLKALRAAGTASRIVLLTVSDAEDDVVAALRAGADGYLLKDMEPEDLLARIRQAAEGRMVVSEHLATTLAAAVGGKRGAGADAIDSLTRRELDILSALAKGASNKMIARRFDISEGTVKVHVKNLLKKLQLRSRTEAAVWAVRHQIR